MRTTHMRRLAAVLVLGGVLAGCGGGGGDDDDGVASVDENAAADETDDQDDGDASGGGRIDDSEMQDAMLEYSECMRDNGIDMPDPQFDEDGGVQLGFRPDSGIDPESEEFTAAEEECRPILEDARPDVQLSPEEQAEMQDRLTAMAECMRARGHDMPDPQVSGDGGVMIRSEAGPDGQQGGPPDEEFEQDMEECSEEAGMEGRGPVTNRSGDEEGDER